MCEMARRGWISYCKESSEDVDYFNLLISNAQEIGLKVLQGSESCVAASLLDGACGIVPCCANFEPQTFVRAYEAAQRRDVVRTLALSGADPGSAPESVAGTKELAGRTEIRNVYPGSRLREAGFAFAATR